MISAYIAFGLCLLINPAQLVLVNPGGTAPSRSTTTAKIRGIEMSKYHSHTEMSNLLYSLESQYPDMAKVHQIGTSVEGRKLLAIQVTTNINKKVLGKPKMKFVGGIHGNEPVGRELCLIFAQYLLHHFEEYDDVTQAVNETDIYILPDMNPDGFSKAVEGECSGSTGKRNANGVDLSSNFPEHFPNSGASTTKEPETQAMMRWIRNNPFVLSVAFRGGYVLTYYPFESSKYHNRSGYASKSADDVTFHRLAKTYSDTHMTMHNGKDCGDHFPEGIINGAEWSEVRGSMGDYNYLHGECFEITAEVSCCKYPNATELSYHWLYNGRALVKMAHYANMGVKGIITDGSTGQGIPNTKVTVDGINHTITSTYQGEYWRLLESGDYTLRFNAPNYIEGVENVTVPAPTDYRMLIGTVLDVQLQHV